MFIVVFLVGIVTCVDQLAIIMNLRWQNVYSVEKNCNRTLENVIHKKKISLNQFSRRFENLISSRSPYSSKQYLFTPLKALAITRRLAEEWTALVCMIHGNFGLSQLGLDTNKWPHGHHITLGAYQVMRIQFTYGYDTRQLVKGIVSGNKVTSNVTAADCFHIGRSFWEYNHIDEAMEWFEQALYKISLGDTSTKGQIVMEHVLPYLCYAGSKKTKHMELVRLLKQTLGSQIEMVNHKAWWECSTINDKINKSPKHGHIGVELGEERLEEHRKACQGQTAPKDRRLRCRFLHYNRPHLRMQPFKVEEMNIDPPILRFHQVIIDNEADELIKFVTKYLEFQTEVGSNGTYYSNFRTTNGNWIYHNESEVNERLCRRMEDMTQLSLTTAEPSKMTRYGSAGEFATHHDFFTTQKRPFDENRIAVLMFYLTDVQEGGYTIFPKLNLTVKPLKNSAILWFNILPSGEKDMRTTHAGCPVVWGTKWVLVKHIHNGGQEFKKPCGLHENDSFTHYYIPREEKTMTIEK